MGGMDFGYLAHRDTQGCRHVSGWDVVSQPYHPLEDGHLSWWNGAIQ